MATKKSAAITKATKVDDLTAAGIDVKLSKMEIADYIAAKSKEELEKRQKQIQEENNNTNFDASDVVLTGEQHSLVELYCRVNNATVTGKQYQFTRRYENPVLCINISGDTNNLFINLAEDKLPLEIKKYMCNQREYHENWNRIRDLDSKKHRTMLIEQILSGSESGKKVLNDLNAMIQRAVNG